MNRSTLQYVRPNQDWTCGHAKDGCPCPLGPTTSGRCQADFECQPFKSGDQWLCTRPASLGSVCPDGPLPDGSCCRPIAPCIPVRSLRSRRRQVTFALLALSIGIGLIILSLPRGGPLMSPGPLSAAHGSIASECSDCHVTGPGIQGILKSITTSVAHEQSKRCLACHQELGDDALLAHSVSSDHLQRVSNVPTETSESEFSLAVALAKSMFGSPHDLASLQCAACHQEHRAAGSDLKQLSNEQCQICHRESFHSFERGHPEFVDYPFRRRSHIYFDHLSHFGRHFANADEAVNMECSSCHVLDSRGISMRLRDFKTTCAECHENQITEDLLPGLVVAAIPAIDVESLGAAGIEIGPWPQVQPIHVTASGQIPSLMKLILASDESMSETLQQIDTLDLRDLRDSSPEQLADAGRLAEAIRQMLADAISPAEHREPVMASESLARLLEHVPSGFIRSMQQRLFPNLLNDGQADDFSVGVAGPGTAEEIAEHVGQSNHRMDSITSGWYLSEADLTLRYRPYGHADAFLRELYDFAVDQGDDALLREMSPYSSGRCFKCHTIDNVDESAVINWHARPSRVVKSWTRFPHRAHVGRGKVAQCESCHQVRKPGSASIFQPHYVHSQGRLETDPARFESDFVPMDIVNCRDCHKQGASGESCLDCHNYHVHTSE